MPLDPQVRLLLDQIAAAGMPALHEMSVADARLAAAALGGMHGAPEPVAAVDDRRIPGPAGDIPIRIYRPHRDAILPALVYLHGGGWVIGDLESHDALCRTLANRVGCVLVSVDYRRAPEAKFPAAAEDAYAATAWSAAHAAELRIDPRRLAVGGDSAGGNLAAVVSLMARDRNAPGLVFQLLIYPVTDASCDTRSYTDNGDGYFLTRDMMLWFWNHYLRAPGDRTNPYAAPLRAMDVRGLPAALVVTAEFDPLRDEGEAYAARLRAAGVPTELRRYDGLIHGFFGMSATIDRAREAVGHASDALRAAFAG